MPLSSFHPATSAWFERALGSPTKAQIQAWPAILRGESTLVCSPTGSGKTLAAFLASIDRLAFGPPTMLPGVRVLYISPLRALAVDVEKNLRKPLVGIVEEARGDARAPTVGVRTGDTPQREREQIRRKPPDILITTPESLYLMLSSRAREVLRFVETVIVDEIHQLVPTKRGTHLFLSLERLERLRGDRIKPLQRIGLSATQKPLEVTARALVGMNRPVTIVDVGEKKPLQLSVDAFEFSHFVDVEEGKPTKPAQASVWPAIHEKILHLVRDHKSTIVFCNSRRLAERLAAALSDLAGKEIARAHHGSIAREKRTEIETMLKNGTIPCIVATSSLELGIDMGAVDLVIQVEAPPQVAAGIQRIGRASHQVGGVPAGIILSKHRGDLLACSAAAGGILDNDVEAVSWPKNPLDVLAQQIVATCLEKPIRVGDMLALVRKAAPYGDLPDSAFAGVLEMLSGRYPSHAFSGLRARITWDRQEGMLAAREGAASIVVSNAGTIPDRGLYGVFWERDGKTTRVGELDEEMVFESREGDVFILGATSWRIERITPDRVMVVPAPGEEAKMPFWRGDGPGRARPFGLRVGALARELAADPTGKVADLRAAGLTKRAMKELAKYVTDQKAITTDVPSDRTVVVERFVHRVNDLAVLILTPLGARVHAPWALAVVERLREAGRGAPDVVYTDDGIVFRICEGETLPELELFLPNENEVDGLLQRALPGSQLFASRFRECSGRALLLPRNRPGKRTPLWAQRKRSTDLLTVASQYPDFPILLEAMRECLQEAFDVDGLKTVLRSIADESVGVRVVDVKKPSPFAKTVLFSFLGALLYDEDMPAPERRAQALHVDHAQLQELLGEADLRSLLEPEVIEAHERFLQRLDAKASSVDGLHDLLLSVGDLSRTEIAERFEGDASAIDTLISARRVFETTIAGEQRIVASEDASRVRDALGAKVPDDLPVDLLEPVRDPLGDLVLRYARTHGPFLTEDIDRRFGTSTVSSLQALAERGLVRLGAFRPEGTDREWCNADVLGSLRGRTLAALKKASAPATADALARFTIAWHGIGKKTSLDTAIEKLEGLPIGIGILENDVLPARVEGFRKADLDTLVATGRISWVALEMTQRQDVRIMLAASEREAELLPAPGHAPGELCEQVRKVLETRGASFSAEIAKAVGGFQPNVGRALWDLMFAQEISNDTLDAARVVVGGSTGRIREGRWFLRKPRLERTPSPTEVIAARTTVLLARHGILTREAASAENVEGGFSRIYPVLRAMEDAGRLQRGLFAEGTSGLQFALPTALTMLRSAKNEMSGGIVLAATDPANLWGSVFSWPDHEVRVTRSIGAHVVLVDGALAAWIPASGDALVTWKCDEAILCETLATKFMPHGRVFFTAIDGKPPREHALAPALRKVGFFPFGPGLARENREDEK